MMKRLLKMVILTLPLAGLGTWTGNAYAAACTSVATGNWGNMATWDCGHVPLATDDVTIVAGHIITMNVNGGAAQSLVINGTANWAQNRTTNVGIGGIAINAGGNITGTANGTITSTGGLAINAVLTSNTVTVTLQTTAAQTISGVGSLARLTVSGNAVTATNSGTLTVRAALAGTGNLSNSATGTLNIGGTVAMQTALVATAVGNTVNYTGAAQTVKATAYHHLGLAGSGAKTMTGVTAIAGNLDISGTATMTANAALTVTGALNYISTGATTLTGATPISFGSFNQSAGTLIDNGNIITVTGTGIGTWIQSAGTFTSTGTVIFTGAAPEIGASSFNNLTINTGAGNAATLTGNATVGGVLTLASGVVSSAANIMEVTSSCTTAIIGGNATSYVEGNLRLYYPTGAGTTPCTFPVGDTTAYAPATVTMTNVTSTQANSSLTVRTDAGDHADTTSGASGIDAARSVNRYWTLTPGISLNFAAYDTTFTFAAGDIDGGANTANFIMGRKNGGAWYYPAMGAKNPTDTTASAMSLAGGFGEFIIGERLMPSIAVLKTVAVYSDPVNLLVNPKFIPGAIAQYTIIASNSGGLADNGSTVIADPVPAGTTLYVNDFGGPGSGPVFFSQGAASSTLTYTFAALNDMADDVSFSNDGGATWTAVPVADALGCDATVPPITHVRVNPKGSFVGRVVAPNPSFQLTFRVCVQ